MHTSPLTLMLPAHLVEAYRDELDRIIARPWRYVDPEKSVENVAHIEIALFSRSLYGNSTRESLAPQAQRFFDAIEQAHSLKWLHIFSSGADNPLYQAIRQSGKVRLSTSTGAAGTTVALTAFTGLLALSRGFLRWVQAKQDKTWQPAHGQMAPRCLSGQTAVVVGTGVIGKEFARLCQSVGVQCVGVRRGADHVPPFSTCVTIDRIDDVLPQADWLVLACPLTPETRGLINTDRLALLRPTAHVINVARGGVIVERDLIAALQERIIAGAYLDVFEVEPLPIQSPLWDMPQVLLSPHNAAANQEYDHHVMQIFLHNLRNYLRKQSLNNEIVKT